MSKILDRADVFVLLVMLAILAVVLSSGSDSSEEESPVVAAQAQQLSPAENPIPCQQDLFVGQRAQVVEPFVRMRYSAGYVSKDDATDTVYYLKKGDVVIIRAGAELKDGLCWWHVEYQGRQGWTADHSQSGDLLLSPAP